ncbi:translation initiation factor [Chitinophagales bacterium]|nr:translation initiation factor [Chitinophagales bacterium]
MAKKMRLEDLKGMVYSTDPDNIPEEEIEEIPALENHEQKLYVSIDKKQRGGKKVTLVEGFQGHEDDLADLGKELKKLCGTGGSVKDGDIIVQGDNRDKIVAYLQKEGYVVKRKGG